MGAMPPVSVSGLPHAFLDSSVALLIADTKYLKRVSRLLNDRKTHTKRGMGLGRGQKLEPCKCEKDSLAWGKYVHNHGHAKTYGRRIRPHT